jgi:hypothetical protein
MGWYSVFSWIQDILAFWDMATGSYFSKQSIDYCCGLFFAGPSAGKWLDI